MDTIPIGSTSLTASRLAYGCWRIAGDRTGADGSRGAVDGRAAVLAAYEAGYTLFDHADIYGQGEAERIFGRVLREVGGMRERVVIATKCGVRRPGAPNVDSPYRYDVSAEHILAAVEGSLGRLQVDTIDVLMLHRADLLADPDEVGEAFSRLHSAGKVRYFGFSNFRPTHLDALKRALPGPPAVHQVEVSLAKLDALTDGTLDQCLAERITPMAWSPLAGGLLGDGATRLLRAQEGYAVAPVVAELETVARELGLAKTTVALAWLLRHPARVRPVIGSTDPARIRDAVRATEVTLGRDPWYRLLTAAQGQPLP